MSHPLYDVTRFEILNDYRVLVAFDDDTESIIDFEPVLYGEVYGPLRDRSLFCQVKLDPEIKTLVWPNGADFDPYVLHEWDRAVNDLSARLRLTEPA